METNKTLSIVAVILSLGAFTLSMSTSYMNSEKQKVGENTHTAEMRQCVLMAYTKDELNKCKDKALVIVLKMK